MIAEIKNDLLKWTNTITNNKYQDAISIELDPITVVIASDSATRELSVYKSDIQDLLQAYVNKNYDSQQITFVVGNPDKIKYAKLREIALHSAEEVKKTRTIISLSNLSADERKIIHKILSRDKMIKTKSIGKTGERKLQIQSR